MIYAYLFICVQIRVYEIDTQKNGIFTQTCTLFCIFTQTVHFFGAVNYNTKKKTKLSAYHTTIRRYSIKQLLLHRPA